MIKSITDKSPEEITIQEFEAHIQQSLDLLKQKRRQRSDEALNGVLKLLASQYPSITLAVLSYRMKQRERRNIESYCHIWSQKRSNNA